PLPAGLADEPGQPLDLDPDQDPGHAQIPDEVLRGPVAAAPQGAGHVVIARRGVAREGTDRLAGHGPQGYRSPAIPKTPSQSPPIAGHGAVERVDGQGTIWSHMTRPADEVFKALADPTRPSLLDELARQDGQTL